MIANLSSDSPDDNIDDAVTRSPALTDLSGMGGSEKKIGVMCPTRGCHKRPP